MKFCRDHWEMCLIASSSSPIFLAREITGENMLYVKKWMSSQKKWSFLLSNRSCWQESKIYLPDLPLGFLALHHSLDKWWGFSVLKSHPITVFSHHFLEKIMKSRFTKFLVIDSYIILVAKVLTIFINCSLTYTIWFCQVFQLVRLDRTARKCKLDLCPSIKAQPKAVFLINI